MSSINIFSKKKLFSIFIPQDRKLNAYVTLVYVLYNDLRLSTANRKFSGIHVNPTLSLRSLAKLPRP